MSDFGNWDEIRTAYQVARMGTVSGAAEVLGVHHATVIRHIDALEARLGTKLFQRHARGYTATEAGTDLLQVAQATDEQLTQLVGRLRGRRDEMTGELIVTSIPEVAQLLTPLLVRFQNDHPGLTVRFLTDARLFRLEYGEAHVAVRAGGAPDEPDNVVQPLGHQTGALFASHDYVARHGLPRDETDLAGHRFVGSDDAESRAPHNRWLRAHVDKDQIVFRATEQRVVELAVRAGAGIGFLSTWCTASDPSLVEVLPMRKEFAAPLWLVTHVDLHRTTKVQALTRFLKAEAQTWPKE